MATKQSSKNAGKNKKNKPSEISSVIIGAVLGAVLTVVLGLVVQIWVLPMFSPAGAITGVIHDEASDVVNHNIGSAIALYTNDAIITDLAGGDQANATTWRNIEGITERYRSLPDFDQLSHDYITISVSPDGKSATATSGTSGIMIQNGVKTNIATFQGEAWSLVLTNDGWKIKSFTYNIPH